MAKIPLKEILAAVDLNSKSLWDDIDDEQRKSLKNEFFILNRYISNVKTNNREDAEEYVLSVNEYFNKHWKLLQKHPKLLWQLLCMCSRNDGKIYYHEWIGSNKKTNNKKYKILLKIYPDMKERDVETLARITTDAELKELVRDLGWSDKEIENL